MVAGKRGGEEKLGHFKIARIQAAWAQGNVVRYLPSAVRVNPRLNTHPCTILQGWARGSSPGAACTSHTMMILLPNLSHGAPHTHTTNQASHPSYPPTLLSPFARSFLKMATVSSFVANTCTGQATGTQGAVDA